jgi:hypothetical protein
VKAADEMLDILCEQSRSAEFYRRVEEGIDWDENQDYYG